jgi:hypothetical protein
MKQSSRDAVSQRFASGATASWASLRVQLYNLPYRESGQVIRRSKHEGKHAEVRSAVRSNATGLADRGLNRDSAKSRG